MQTKKLVDADDVILNKTQQQPEADESLSTASMLSAHSASTKETVSEAKVANGNHCAVHPSLSVEVVDGMMNAPETSSTTSLLTHDMSLKPTLEVGFLFLWKKGSKTEKRMEEEEIEKGDCGPPTRKVFFEILSDLNQAVPNHLAEESQTR